MKRLFFLIGLTAKSVIFDVKMLERGKRTWTGLLGVINEVFVHYAFLHVLLDILSGFVPLFLLIERLSSFILEVPVPQLFLLYFFLPSVLVELRRVTNLLQRSSVFLLPAQSSTCDVFAFPLLNNLLAAFVFQQFLEMPQTAAHDHLAILFVLNRFVGSELRCL